MTIDMSSKAITTRLRRASQLRRLCLSLMKARSAKTETRVETEPSNESRSVGERRDELSLAAPPSPPPGNDAPAKRKAPEENLERLVEPRLGDED